MAAVVVFLVLEAYSPHSFLLTAGRVFAVHVEVRIRCSNKCRAGWHGVQSDSGARIWSWVKCSARALLFHLRLVAAHTKLPHLLPVHPAQAAWFFAASAVLFEHRPEWSDPADMAPVMFVPVLYALILLMVATYMIIGEPWLHGGCNVVMLIIYSHCTAIICSGTVATCATEEL
jgi:hypothetical protein